MDYEALGILAAPAITVICYIIGAAVKATRWNNDKLIPVICGFAGAVLGIVAMFVVPEFPAKDYLTAAAIGIVSGLAATGVNQVKKQITKDSDL